MKSFVDNISRKCGRTAWESYECILAESIKDVASELRMHDALDLIDLVRNRSYTNLQDLVNSSTELYFKPGALIFGWGGDASITWSDGGSVSLDLEFRSRDIYAFFSLILRPGNATIIIHDVSNGLHGSVPSADEFRVVLNQARTTSTFIRPAKGTERNIN